MPDPSQPTGSFFPTIDAHTGEATQTPIEAVASEYAKGAIHFQAGTRIPVTKDGEAGTIPAEQYEEALQNGYTPNFDPNGAAKAFVASMARTVTLGGSDYIARKAAGLGAAVRGEDTHKAEDDARKTLSALQEEHPWAEGMGLVGGMVAPGGIEGLVGKVGRSVDLLKDAREAAAAVKTAKGVENASTAARAAAETEAASGRLARSGLSKIMKWVNPYEAVSAVGGAVERGLGGGALARTAALATEGGIVGALGAADEAEIGNHPLTGEAMWHDAVAGGIFGGSIGLVAAGGERIFSAAGRLADRLAEAGAGGSGKDYIAAERRYGWGGLGHADLELGKTPGEAAHNGLARIRGHLSQQADELTRVVQDADSTFQGVSARQVMNTAGDALSTAADKLDMVGGDSGKLRAGIMQDLKEHLGMREMPAAPEPLVPNAGEVRFDQKRISLGLPEESMLVEPKAPKEIEARRLATVAAREEGLESLRVEKTPKPSKEAYAAYVNKLTKALGTAKAAGDNEGAMRIGRKLMSSKENYLADLESETKARNARRVELVEKAKAQLSDEYGKAQNRYMAAKRVYSNLREEAAKEVLAEWQNREFIHAHDVRATKDYNDNLKVSLAHAREFRKALDARIPYNRSKDALLNASVEVKQSVRGAVEGEVEKAMDTVSRGADANHLGRYLHAKARYGMMKDLERMYERKSGAEAKSFGHFGGFGHHSLAYPLVGAAVGHPAAGVGIAAGAGVLRKYGSDTAAYLMHKAARFAQLRAMRSELELATNKAAKAVIEGETTNFSKLKVPTMAPHEMRLTAADAMATIYKLGGSKALEAKLATLDPNAVVLTPKSSQQMERAARSSVNYLLMQMPPKVRGILQAGGKPSADDLTTTEAHDYLHTVAAASDPHVTLDAMAKGQLTMSMAAAHAVSFPAHTALLRDILRRQVQDDKRNASLLSSGRKFAIGLLTGQDNPSLTMHLQSTLISLNAMSTAPQAGGKGMSHAAAKEAGAAPQLLATQSQMIEGAPPGRRGKTGRGAFSL